MRIAIDWQAFRNNLALFTAIAVFMAIINPYEAARFDFFIYRFAYWFGLILVGGLAGRVGLYIADYLQTPAHWALTILLSSATASLGVTVAIYGFESFRRGSFDIPIAEFPFIYGLVFVISVAISSVAYLAEKVQETSAPQAETGDPKTKFLERLPVKYRTGDLYAISSEDHYLRVHTSLGEEMILMRLADAIRELAGADGLQTHRSWWVARTGVSDVKKDGGKTTLVLKSGAEAPVSRTYAKAVKDAGLGD